ncbi:MAG: hypothetical protein LBT46_00580 [Planctomycetaceae bacterium]|jgi:hypothetical protein|nr:hypothetical protein [Planctomycetaceae bacterium]
MSVYSEYIGKHLSFEQLVGERKHQLERIAELRGRDVIVYASDISSKNCPNSIDRSDLLPFNDQLSVLKGDAVDIILQTPGGLAEVVEDLVRSIRSKFENVGVIVPGMAYSAGTIFAMAADEILMSRSSSLGPIDAQIVSNGKRFSADAFLEGLEKIKNEAAKNNMLNIAYIPILQSISPGEIQHCENAQSFSKTLVTDWLRQYKFKLWVKHSSTGKPVTEEEKKAKAEKIAVELCNQGRWLTHGRSIKIDDLKNLGLQITDYSTNSDLFDAVNRYYTLLQMSFDANIYKLYETPTSQIYKALNIPTAPQMSMPAGVMPLCVEHQCSQCGNVQVVQFSFEQTPPTILGAILFPADNLYKCKNCQTENDIAGLRKQIESQANKKIS